MRRIVRKKLFYLEDQDSIVYKCFRAFNTNTKESY